MKEVHRVHAAQQLGICVQAVSNLIVAGHLARGSLPGFVTAKSVQDYLKRPRVAARHARLAALEGA